MTKQFTHAILLIWGLSFGTSILPGWSQSLRLDSLIATLEHMPDDTIKMFRLIDVCVASLRESAYEQSHQYASQALALSEKYNHARGKAGALGNMGIIAFHLGQYETALAHHMASLEINKALHLRKSIANNYSNIGMLYDSQGQFEKAIDAYHTALSYRDDTDLRGKGAAYNNLGIIYFKKGDYARALEYFLLSLEIDEQGGDKLDLAFSVNNVGLVYGYQKKYDKAIEYYKKTQSLCREVGHKECVAGTYTNIANLLKEQGHLQEALDQHLHALETFEEIGNAHEIGSTAGNIGAIYHDLGEYPLSLEYYTRSYNQAKAENDLYGIAQALSNLGGLYRDMQRFPEAMSSFRESIDLFRKIGTIQSLQNTYLQLSRLDSIMGNHSDALLHYKQYHALKDSIQNEANMRALAEIQEKYESEKKDKEIVKLESDQQVSSLQLKIKSEQLRRIQANQQQLYAKNEMQMQQIALLDKDSKLQALELEKNEAQMAGHEIESRNKEAELLLLNQENQIKSLRLKKQQEVFWYSITGFILFGLIAILYYRQFRIGQKLKLQMLRNKIASDLHDEVGSTLSSIAIFSEVAQQQSREVIPLLDTIRDNSRKMLEAMGDIVWTINPDNDQFEKIILRMRNFAFQLLGARKIEFEFIANEDVSELKLSMDVRKNLYLIFKEAANNLVKYSSAKQAKFSVTESDGWLTMIISDNGQGFNPSTTVAGNGIESMKQRAKEIGAHFQINSQIGKGTSIELKLAL